MRRNWIYLFCAAILVAASCSKKVNTTQTFIIWNDTLTATELLAYFPDTTADSLRIQKAIRWVSLAGSIPSDTGKIYSSLAEQLSLQVGGEWTPAKAALIYKAAEKIKKYSENSKNTTGIKLWAESLFVESLHNLKSADLAGKINIDTSIYFKKNSENEAKIYASILEISQKTGDLLADFLSSENSEVGNLNAMIKGLLFSEKEEKIVKKNGSAPNEKQAIDNSVLALKYRDQKSIRDSIEKRSPDIRSLYKKFLKTDDSIEGVVLVTFTVNPDGEVTETEIKNSQFKNTEFLKLLKEYTATIHFKTVPRNIGNMKFDFPFEFNSEM
jgi:TonB family protein